MINHKTVAVVVPAYNEEKQILHVISSMPDFVDRIVVINDCSTDKTGAIVSDYINQQTSFMVILFLQRTDLRRQNTTKRKSFFTKWRKKSLNTLSPLK